MSMADLTRERKASITFGNQTWEVTPRGYVVFGKSPAESPREKSNQSRGTRYTKTSVERSHGLRGKTTSSQMVPVKAITSYRSKSAKKARTKVTGNNSRISGRRNKILPETRGPAEGNLRLSTVRVNRSVRVEGHGQESLDHQKTAGEHRLPGHNTDSPSNTGLHLLTVLEPPLADHTQTDARGDKWNYRDSSTTPGTHAPIHRHDTNPQIHRNVYQQQAVPFTSERHEEPFDQTLNSFLSPSEYNGGAAHVKLNLRTDASTPSLLETQGSDWYTKGGAQTGQVAADSRRGAFQSPSIYQDLQKQSLGVSYEEYNLDVLDLDSDSELKQTRSVNSDQDPSVTAGPDYKHFVRDDHDHTTQDVEFGPDWEEAKQTWRYAWEIHVYFLGSVFALVGVYNVLSIGKLRKSPRLLPIGYFLPLHSLLAAVCVTRSFYLMFDGYNSRSTYRPGLNRFIYSVPFPCMTTAFSFLVYWLLQTVRLQLLPEAIQKIQVLFAIIVAHFLISITTDVIIIYGPGVHVLQFVSLVFFAAWGLFLFFGFAYHFRRLYAQVDMNQSQDRFSVSTATPVASNSGTKSKPALKTAANATFVASICGLAIVGLEVYAFVGIYKIFTTERPKLWPWWMYHTVLRCVEIAMCAAMSYCVSLPLRFDTSREPSSYSVLCAPCSELLCCNRPTNITDSVSGWREVQLRSPFKSPDQNSESSTDSSTAKFLTNGSNSAIQATETQPNYCSDPDSLLIIEDVYVSFQTDYDINRIVDSVSEITHQSYDIHNANTFHLRDRFVSPDHVTGANHCQENTDIIDYQQNKCSSDCQANMDSTGQEIDEIAAETDSTAKSRRSSMTSSEFFRVPSSLSLAGSMEDELFRAFENLRGDENV